jgi:ribosomal protein S18 acetylase RimI-like enzyme
LLEIKSAKILSSETKQSANELFAAVHRTDNTFFKPNLTNDSGVIESITPYFWIEKDGNVSSLLAIFVEGYESNYVANAWLMTCPDDRDQGYATALVEAAKAELKVHNIDELVFMSETAFLDQNEWFVEKYNLIEPLASAYEMKLDKLVEPQKSWIEVRLASLVDLELVAELHSVIYSVPREATTCSAKKDLSDENTRCFVFYKDNVGIGLVKVDLANQSAYIHTVGILEGYRGKGYAQEGLVQVIKAIQKETSAIPTIQVRSQNIVAIKVYEKIGFKVRTIYNWFATSSK